MENTWKCPEQNLLPQGQGTAPRSPQARSFPPLLSLQSLDQHKCKSLFSDFLFLGIASYCHHSTPRTPVPDFNQGLGAHGVTLVWRLWEHQIPLWCCGNRSTPQYLLTSRLAGQADPQLAVQVGHGVVQHLEQLDGEAGGSGAAALQQLDVSAFPGQPGRNKRQTAPNPSSP